MTKISGPIRHQSSNTTHPQQIGEQLDWKPGISQSQYRSRIITADIRPVNRQRPLVDSPLCQKCQSQSTRLDMEECPEKERGRKAQSEGTNSYANWLRAKTFVQKYVIFLSKMSRLSDQYGKANLQDWIWNIVLRKREEEKHRGHKLIRHEWLRAKTCTCCWVTMLLDTSQ